MDGEQRMTSLEFAKVTGKQHKDVMKAIRNMEVAWEKITRRKFAPCERTVEYPNGSVKKFPFIHSPKPSVCTSPPSSTTRLAHD